MHIIKYGTLETAINSLGDPNRNLDPNEAATIFSYFEPIATLWGGNMLGEKYVKSFFGSQLKNFSNNKSFIATLRETNKQYGSLDCPNLEKLLELSKTWK